MACPDSLRWSCPASLIVTPDSGSSATTYIPTRLPNGLASCEARYTAPSRAFGKNGVLILTVPIFDAFPQKFTPGSNGSFEPKLPGTLDVNAGTLTLGDV